MGQSIRKHAPVIAKAFWILALLLVPASAFTQESSSFKIKRLSTTTMAEPSAASASYRSAFVADVAYGSSGVCPAGLSSTLGFWSVLGAQPVPVLLIMARSESEPAQVDLTWSGQAAAFTGYRSASPIDLVDAGNVLVTTGNCNASDPNADEEPLLFYKVVPDGE